MPIKHTPNLQLAVYGRKSFHIYGVPGVCSTGSFKGIKPDEPDMDIPRRQQSYESPRQRNPSTNWWLPSQPQEKWRNVDTFRGTIFPPIFGKDRNFQALIFFSEFFGEGWTSGWDAVCHVGFLTRGGSRGSGNWGTLRIPFRKLGNLREHQGKLGESPPPLKNPVIVCSQPWDIIFLKTRGIWNPPTSWLT